MFILEKLEDLRGQGEYRRAVTSNDANHPFGRHFNNSNHYVSNTKIQVLCPISDSKDNHKRHEMRTIYKLDTVHSIVQQMSNKDTASTTSFLA